MKPHDIPLQSPPVDPHKDTGGFPFKGHAFLRQPNPRAAALGRPFKIATQVRTPGLPLQFSVGTGWEARAEWPDCVDALDIHVRWRGPNTDWRWDPGWVPCSVRVKTNHVGNIGRVLFGFGPGQTTDLWNTQSDPVRAKQLFLPRRVRASFKPNIVSGHFSVRIHL